MFGYSKLAKGPGVKEYKYDPTDSGSSLFINHMTCMYWFTLHSIVELNLWLMLTLRDTQELLVRVLWQLSLASGLLSLLVSSGLNYSCWFMCGVCRVDWTAAAELYLVFTNRLD